MTNLALGWDKGVHTFSRLNKPATRIITIRGLIPARALMSDLEYKLKRWDE